MNEFCFRSACDIARAIREKEVSALEVVETHLRRIEATHSALNAVVTLVADRALDEARAADSRLAGDEPIGALHGVPVTIKDSIETAGILTTGRHHRARQPCSQTGCDGCRAASSRRRHRARARPTPRS